MAYDADINLSVGTDLDAGSLTKTASELESEFNKIFKSSFGKKTSTQFKQLELSASKSLSRMRELVAELNNIQFNTEPSEEVQYFTEKLKDLKNQYKATKQELTEKIKIGAPDTEINDLKNKLSSIKDSAKAVSGDLESALATQLQNTILGAMPIAEELRDVQNELVLTKQRMSDTGESVSRLKGFFDRLGSSVIGSIKALQRFGSAAVAKGIKYIGNKLNEFRKRSDGAGSSIKRFIKAGIGIASLAVLFNKLKSAVMEGIGNLEKYSPQFKSTMDSFRNALTGLKNAFGAAFAPILSAVVPALVTLISYVTAAINAIGKLIALLTGKSTYTAAVGGFNAVGGAAGGAAGAAEKLKKELAGFDDVEILKNDDSGGGGGGGGGGDASSMFEEVPIDENIARLAEMIKEAWAKADFTEIGTLIGTKLRDALESIPWDEIKAVVWRIAHSLATLLNGFLETPGLFDAIGTTLGEALNTALIGLNEFAKTFHWDSLGLAISDSINAFFRTANPRLAASTFSHWAIGILTTLYTAIENVDWQQIGRWIRDFIAGIDWVGIAEALAEAIGAAFGALAGLIVGALGDIPGAIKEYFAKHIQEAKDSGGSVIQGILDGIIDAIVGIGTWIKEHIFDPFIKGFKAAFGIDSDSSSETKPFGKGLIQGILDGMLELIKDIGTWIYEHILKPIIAAFATPVIKLAIGLVKAKEWAEDVWEFVKDKKETIIKTVKAKFKKLGVWAGEALEAVKSGSQTVVKTVITKMEVFGEKVVEGAKTLWNSIKSNTAIKTIRGVVSNTFTTMKESFLSIKSSTVVKTISGIVSTTFTVVKEAFNGLKSNTITKTIAGFLANSFANVKTNFNGIKSDTVTKTITGVIDKTFTALQTAWNAIQNSTVVKTIKGATEKTYTNTKNLWEKLKDSKIVKTIGGVLDNTFKSAKKDVDKVENKTVTVHMKATKDWLFDTLISQFYGLQDKVITVWEQVKKRFSAEGGVYTPYSGWSNIPQYAGGTTNAHGSMFIAGEAGPEVVGHIGGRTEVLNRSQLASTMYSSIISAMMPLTTALENLLRYFSTQLGNVVTGVYTALSNPIPVMLNDKQLSDIFVNFDSLLPAVVSGQIIPYTTKLSSLEDKISMQNEDRVTNEELRRMLDDVIKAVDKVQFYIGDEQIARHVSTGAQKIDRRYNLVAQGV